MMVFLAGLVAGIVLTVGVTYFVLWIIADDDLETEVDS